jgi:hypothetical protein
LGADVQLLRSALYGLGLAAVWVVLAWLNEGTVYNAAPLLVSAVVPIGLALSGRPTLGAAAVAAVVGAAMALSGTALLVLLHRLEGPSLLPSGNATTEAAIFSVAGAGIGYVLASFRRKNGGD